MTGDLEAELRASMIGPLDASNGRWADFGYAGVIELLLPALAAVVREMVEERVADMKAVVDAWRMFPVEGVHVLTGEEALAKHIARLTEERDQAEIALNRAQGALADAATVGTDKVEAGIRQLTEERDRLRAALTAIAKSPHKSYEHVRDGQYGIGVADGHRCAALTAEDALPPVTGQEPTTEPEKERL